MEPRCLNPQPYTSTSFQQKTSIKFRAMAQLLARGPACRGGAPLLAAARRFSGSSSAAWVRRTALDGWWESKQAVGSSPVC